MSPASQLILCRVCVARNKYRSSFSLQSHTINISRDTKHAWRLVSGSNNFFINLLPFLVERVLCSRSSLPTINQPKPRFSDRCGQMRTLKLAELAEREREGTSVSQDVNFGHPLQGDEPSKGWKNRGCVDHLGDDARAPSPSPSPLLPGFPARDPCPNNASCSGF